MGESHYEYTSIHVVSTIYTWGPLGYMCGKTPTDEISIFVWMFVVCANYDVQTDSYFMCTKIAMLSCSSGAIICIVRRVRTSNASLTVYWIRWIQLQLFIPPCDFSRGFDVLVNQLKFVRFVRRSNGNCACEFMYLQTRMPFDILVYLFVQQYRQWLRVAFTFYCSEYRCHHFRIPSDKIN